MEGTNHDHFSKDYGEKSRQEYSECLKDNLLDSDDVDGVLKVRYLSLPWLVLLNVNLMHIYLVLLPLHYSSLNLLILEVRC